MESTGISVLFIGNSYTSRNNLPGATCELLRQCGVKMEWRSVSAGGATLRKHILQGEAVRAVRSRAWDYIVVQEQSQMPVRDRAAYQTAAEQFRRMCFEARRQQKTKSTYTSHARNRSSSTRAKQQAGRGGNNAAVGNAGRDGGDRALQDTQDPGTVLVLLGTWPRAGSTRREAASLGTAFEDTLATLRGKAPALPQRVLLAPAGVAWERALAQRARCGLHDKDGSHPSVAGTYLTALVLCFTLGGQKARASATAGAVLPANLCTTFTVLAGAVGPDSAGGADTPATTAGGGADNTSMSRVKRLRVGVGEGLSAWMQRLALATVMGKSMDACVDGSAGGGDSNAGAQTGDETVRSGQGMAPPVPPPATKSHPIPATAPSNQQAESPAARQPRTGVSVDIDNVCDLFGVPDRMPEMWKRGEAERAEAHAREQHEEAAQREATARAAHKAAERRRQQQEEQARAQRQADELRKEGERELIARVEARERTRERERAACGDSPAGAASGNEIDAETQATNRVEQEQEIEALQAIYGESFAFAPGTESCHDAVSCEYCVHVDSTPWTVRVSYPASYPSHTPPDCSIDGARNALERARLLERLHEVFIPGAAVVFTWISAIAEDAVA
eukprot:g723.t1